MKAVVLAAGEGRRLRPLTKSMGKGMLPVANRPVLSYVLDSLIEAGIRDVVMVVGYHKEKVMNRFGDGRDLGIDIEYVDQKFQLGTAHAILQTKDKVDERFLVVPGDSLVGPEGLQELLKTPEDEWGMLVASTSNSSKYGVVEVKEDRLISIKEKPKLTEDIISSGAPSVLALALWEYQDPSMSTLINTGTYMMGQDLFLKLEERDVGEPLTLTSCISEEARKRKVSIKHADLWLDAVYPWDLLALNEHCLNRDVSRATEGIVEEGTVIKGQVSMGHQSRIRANSVIEGPVMIGAGSTIGPGAYIGSNTSIGENCSIGPFSVVKGSLIMDDVTIGAHSSVYQSVIANGSSIGDFFGVEKGEYTVRLENYTSKKTLGAIIGSDSEISHHVALSPGIIVGQGCRLGAMNRVRENMPDGSRMI